MFVVEQQWNRATLYAISLALLIVGSLGCDIADDDGPMSGQPVIPAGDGEEEQNEEQEPLRLLCSEGPVAWSPPQDGPFHEPGRFALRIGDSGSGILISPGLALTAAHVVQDACIEDERCPRRCRITAVGGSVRNDTLCARVTEYDADLDFAVLELDSALLEFEGEFDVSDFTRDVVEPRENTEVRLYHHPGGADLMLSNGVVSVLAEGPDIGHTAVTDAGSSGAALVDAQGRVVGLHLAITEDGPTCARALSGRTLLESSHVLRARETNCQDGDSDGWIGGRGCPGATDCDDGDGTVNPAALESLNHADDDCDGRIDEGTMAGDEGCLELATQLGAQLGGACRNGPALGECEPEGRWACRLSPHGDQVVRTVSCAGARTPHEENCEERDLDCDGHRFDAGDLDGDGYGTCEAHRDCAPLDPSRHPQAAEVANGLDDDCDRSVDEGVGAIAEEGGIHWRDEGVAQLGHVPVECAEGMVAVGVLIYPTGGCQRVPIDHPHDDDANAMRPGEVVEHTVRFDQLRGLGLLCRRAEYARIQGHDGNWPAEPVLVPGDAVIAREPSGDELARYPDWPPLKGSCSPTNNSHYPRTCAETETLKGLIWSRAGTPGAREDALGGPPWSWTETIDIVCADAREEDRSPLVCPPDSHVVKLKYAVNSGLGLPEAGSIAAGQWSELDDDPLGHENVQFISVGCASFAPVPPAGP